MSDHQPAKDALRAALSQASGRAIESYAVVAIDEEGVAFCSADYGGKKEMNSQRLGFYLNDMVGKCRNFFQSRLQPGKEM